MKKALLAAALTAVFGAAFAKLPPPVLDDAAKAKAAETAARTAWQAKVDAFQLCRAQDRVVAHYKKTGGAAAAKAAPGTANMTTAATGGPGAATAPAAPVAAAAPAAAPPAAPAAPSAPMQMAAAKPAGAAPANLSPSSAGGTPVVASAAPAGSAAPCSDPGPFAFNPPLQTPLETSGAHSPAGTATSPPSVRADSAQIAPTPATPPKK